MVIAGLIIGIVIITALIFLLLKSMVVKLLALSLVVLAFVLVIALGGNKFNSFVKPIGIEDDKVLVYQDGEPIQFNASEVTRVDVYENTQTGKLAVRFVVSANMYEISISSLAYEFGIRNALLKTFGNLVNDSTV